MQLILVDGMFFKECCLQLLNPETVDKLMLATYSYNQMPVWVIMESGFVFTILRCSPLATANNFQGSKTKFNHKYRLPDVLIASRRTEAITKSSSQDELSLAKYTHAHIVLSFFLYLYDYC